MLVNSLRRVSAAVTLLVTVILVLLTGIGIDAGSLTLVRPALASTEPDLTITTITLSPELPESGETVTISIIVENLGTGSADSSHLTGTLDGKKVLSVWLDPLAAGAVTTKTFTWQAEAGDHFFVALADADDDVAESDETNNSSIISFSPLAPDLIVKSITWTPYPASAGDTVTFTVSIGNTGDKISGWSSVQVIIDGISRGYFDVPRLSPGDSTTISLTWIARAGGHPIRAIVDPYNQTQENNETNNELLVGYGTAAPDLMINDITWSIDTIYPTLFVTFYVEVANIGTGDSNSANLAYYIDDVYQDTLFLGHISAGSTVTQEFNRSVDEGHHSIRAIIDYDNRVNEADETNNTKTVNLSEWCPDLTLFLDHVEPAYRREGDTVTVRMAIHNVGKAQAGQCRIDYYLNGELVKQQTIEAIEPDSTVFDNLVYTVQAASYDLKVIVDPDNLIMEEDETNNTREVKLDNDIRPDLVLAGISTSPQSPDIGESVDITATVKNLGAGPAPSSHVVFYINGTENAPSQIDDLDSGEEISITFKWTAQVGIHTVKVVADASDWVSEANEDNNDTTITITTNTPDLAISSISWSPQDPVAGETVNFTATVNNLGIAQAGEFRLHYLVDGLSKGTHSIATLEVGGSRVKEFFWIAEPGFHEVTIAVDYENKIAEIDENNNTLTLGFPPPDIAIVSFSTSSTNPKDGEKIILDLKLTNQGSGRSAPSRIQIDVDDVPLAVVDMAELEPDETVQQSFSWQAEGGTHTIKATADISNAVWEIDEINNEKLLALNVLSEQEAESPSESPEVTITSPEASNPLSDVRASITGKTTDIEIGEYLVLTMSAANAGSTDVHFDANLVLPDGMSLVAPDFELTGDNTYVINLNLEAGKDELSDIYIESTHEGSFIIKGQFTPNSASMQSFSIPVKVRDNDNGLGQLFDNGLYLIGAIAGVVIIIFLLRLAYSGNS